MMLGRHGFNLLAATALVGAALLAAAPAYAQGGGDGGAAGSAGASGGADGGMGGAAAGGSTGGQGSPDGGASAAGTGGGTGSQAGGATDQGSGGGQGATASGQGGALPQGPIGGPVTNVGIGTDRPDPAQRRPQPLERPITGYMIEPPVVSTLSATYLEPAQDPPLDRATVGLPNNQPTEIVMGHRAEEFVVTTLPATFRLPSTR